MNRIEFGWFWSFCIQLKFCNAREKASCDELRSEIYYKETTTTMTMTYQDDEIFAQNNKYHLIFAYRNENASIERTKTLNA